MTSSIFPNSGVRKTGAMECATITIDDVFRHYRWPAPDLIKIDVEGAEHAVLLGMSEIARNSSTLKLIVEFLPDNLQRAGCSADQFFGTLLDLGFSKFWIIQNELEEIHVPQGINDMVARCGNYSYFNLLCSKD